LTPCFLRHATNALRVALEPPVDDAEAEVVLELLELLPHAASTTAVVTAANAGITRRTRR
jgi:hypothetical protein